MYCCRSRHIPVLIGLDRVESFVPWADHKSCARNTIPLSQGSSRVCALSDLGLTEH